MNETDASPRTQSYTCPICGDDLVWADSGAVCLRMHGKIITFEDNAQAQKEIEGLAKQKRSVAKWLKLPEAVRNKGREAFYSIDGVLYFRLHSSNCPFGEIVKARLPDTNKKKLRWAWFTEAV